MDTQGNLPLPCLPKKGCGIADPGDCKVPLGIWPSTPVHVSSPGCLPSEGLSSPKCLTSAQEGEKKGQALEVPMFESQQPRLPGVTLVKGCSDMKSDKQRGAFTTVSFPFPGCMLRPRTRVPISCLHTLLQTPICTSHTHTHSGPQEAALVEHWVHPPTPSWP